MRRETGASRFLPPFRVFSEATPRKKGLGICMRPVRGRHLELDLAVLGETDAEVKNKP